MNYLYFITIFLMVMQSQSLAQNEFQANCQSLLSKNVNLEETSLEKDLFELLACSPVIDSFDVIYMTPYVTTILIQSRRKTHCYQDLLNDFKKLKKEASYLELREKVYPDFLLKRKVATIEDWEEDKKLFLQLGASKDFLKNYKNFLDQHVDGVKTHAILTKEFKNANRKFK